MPPYVEPHWELDAVAPHHNNPTAPEGIYAQVWRNPAHGKRRKTQHTLRVAPAQPRHQAADTPGRRTADGKRPRWTRPSKRRGVMPNLPHNSIKAIGRKGGSSSMAAAGEQEAEGELAMEIPDAKMRRRGTGPRGRTPWFYRGDGSEKGNRPPRSPGLPRVPSRHAAGHAPAVTIFSHHKPRRTARLPQANPDSLPTRGSTGHKDLFSLFGPPRAQRLGGRPNQGWVRERPKIKGVSITEVSIRGQAPVRQVLNKIPANRMPRSS